MQAVDIPTCDELLDLCTVVVEKQKEAIDAQQVVIKKADELIQVKDEEIKNEGSTKAVWRGIGIVEGILLLIILL